MDSPDAFCAYAINLSCRSSFWTYIQPRPGEKPQPWMWEPLEWNTPLESDPTSMVCSADASRFSPLDQRDLSWTKKPNFLVTSILFARTSQHMKEEPCDTTKISATHQQINPWPLLERARHGKLQVVWFLSKLSKFSEHNCLGVEYKSRVALKTQPGVYIHTVYKLYICSMHM